MVINQKFLHLNLEEEHIEDDKHDNNVDAHLQEACKVLEEKVMIERKINSKNFDMIEEYRKRIINL